MGTELLLGQIVDTHAPTMAKILAECGIGCQRRSTVGDNLDRIVTVLKESLSRADVVVTIGGLGPTLDDVTRDAIAIALDDELELVPAMEQELRELFSQRNIRWSESILRQAYKPKCAELIPNANGTAPGLFARKNNKSIFALPGPRGEFDPMAKGSVKTLLASLSPGQIIHSKVLRIVGMGESHVEDLIKDLMESENPTVAPYAHPGEVHLRMTSKASSLEIAQAALVPVEAKIREILGDHVFGVDNSSLEETVLHLLVEARATLSVAESMTGGGLGSRITSTPGASAVFLGGIIAYVPAVKRELLGVSAESLRDDSPVSESVAREMAEGVRDRLSSTYGLSITGNAGPTSDEGDRPLGLYYVACAGPRRTVVEEVKTRSEREEVRRRATQVALGLLRQELMAKA